ncbi:MAG: conjugal transfer protein [Clostridia bacterium]|nr:conjugal transfer protein [Clostridia bacterium]
MADGIWLPCPVCNRRTRIQVHEDTVLIHFPLYCHWCRKESLVNLFNLKLYTVQK